MAGRDAEADHVRQRVELLAEFGVGSGGAGDEAVEGVEHDGEADGAGGIVEVRDAALEGRQHGVEAAQEVAHGEQAGQHVDAAPHPLAGRPANPKSCCSSSLVSRLIGHASLSQRQYTHAAGHVLPRTRHNFGVLGQPNVHPRSKTNHAHALAQG